LNVAAPNVKKAGGGASKLFVAILVLLLLAGAFLAGARYRDRIPFFAGQPKPEPTVAAAPKPVEEPFVRFERARREVDKDPRAWLASETSKELVASAVQSPLDSPKPEFLYLYGRANLLTGNPDEAWRAFDAAVAKADASPGAENALIKKEATLGMAAVSLKTQSSRQKALSHYDELTKSPTNQTAP
jgi:tetratricopeptide (TPR) repeat protein